MAVDHIMVGALTAASIALLVWIEIRSRRNSANQQEKRSAPRRSRNRRWTDHATGMRPSAEQLALFSRHLVRRRSHESGSIEGDRSNLRC